MIVNLNKYILQLFQVVFSKNGTILNGFIYLSYLKKEKEIKKILRMFESFQ